MAASSGEPEVVGREVHTPVFVDCLDDDGPIPGILVDRAVGFVGHVALRICPGGYNITVFDTERLSGLMDGQTNPMRSPRVVAVLREVLPLVFYTNGKSVFGNSPE